MDTKIYDSIPEFLEGIPAHGSIHLECNQEMGEDIFQYIRAHWEAADTAFLTFQDKGYERQTVMEYIRFFHS